MMRQEGIQKIVWALLAHADAPQKAVGAASTLKSRLGQRSEQDFRNLLRAAGLFARDDDGFYVRYALANPSQAEWESLLDVPPATHLLSVPVPVEPRMRIAYGVFTGLLLKHLYQCYGVVPLQVTEGTAALWAPGACSIAVSTLPDDSDELWREFQCSHLATEALTDGIEAMLSAVGNIGGITLTHSLAGGPVMPALLEILPGFERKFQAQGGMRLDYYLRENLNSWRDRLKVSLADDADVEAFWEDALAGGDIQIGAAKVAVSLVNQAIRNAIPTMQFRSISASWRGEGSGPTRRKGQKENLGWSQRKGWRDAADPSRSEKMDKAVESALSGLEIYRYGAGKLDHWVARKAKDNDSFEVILRSVTEEVV